MTKITPNPLIYLPIPIETFRNFFCLDMITSKNDTPLLADETTAFDFAAMTCDLFDGFDGLQTEILNAKSAKSQQSVLVSTQAGDVFAALTYQKDGVTHHVLTVGKLSLMPDEDGDASYGLLVEYLLTGHEVGQGRDIVFETDIALIKILNTKEDAAQNADRFYFDYPIDDKQFYAAMNYMRFAMMSCLQGDTMEPELNQVLLMADNVDAAKKKFVDAVGYPDLKTAIGDYRLGRTSYEMFLRDHKSENGLRTPELTRN